MVELYFVPAGIPDHFDPDRPVVVLDIFRVSTSITTALAAGARDIRIAGSKSEATALKKQHGKKCLLAGERKGLKIEGYDFGNSPLEMEPEKLAGRTVIFNSTNGTRLLKHFDGFKSVGIGSLVSLSKTVEYLQGFEKDPIIACAGQVGLFSYEDSLAAGMIIARLGRKEEELDDAANFAVQMISGCGDDWKEKARNSYHGRYLSSLGMGRDLDFCLDIDRFDFIPVKTGNMFVRQGREL
jgi:2-phosphosulfolactate phosphatase